MAFGDSTLKSGHGDGFPPPNYINPTTRVPIVLGLTISTCALALLFTGGRLYARTSMKKALGVDDWMMLGATFLATALSILGAISCQFGLGYHLWDLRSEWGEPYYKIGFVFQLIYPLCVGLTKMSLCQTYLRIFPSQTSHIFSHATTVFVGAYTLTCLVLLFTQCHPLKGYWDKDIKIHCVDMHINMMAIGAINTTTDFLVYLWPARYLWRIRLPLKQRVGLVFVFTCGLIVCVAGVFRLVFLNRYFTNVDLLWDAALTTSVGIVEVNVGIVCGCLPCIKPLLNRVLPSVFSTHGRTSDAEHLTPRLGDIIAFQNRSHHQREKDGSTSALRGAWLDDVEEEEGNEGASINARYSFRPSSKHGGRIVQVRRRDSSPLPKNGIVIERTVGVEKL